MTFSMRTMLFVVQVAISSVVLTFSIYMLINHNDACGTANGIYLPIITSIVGLFLPSPLAGYGERPGNEPLVRV